MKTFLTALATAAFAAAGVWLYCGSTRPTPVVVSAPVVTPVAAMPSASKPSNESSHEFEGRLEPSSEVEIRTPLTGYPVRLRAESGDFVQKGQLLVELGDSKLEESVRQAEAALNVVKADFQARETRLAHSEKELPSTIAAAQPVGAPASHRLVVPSIKHGPTPEEELDRSRLQQAEAAVSRAKLELAETRIVAPISGYVIQRRADGELSKPDVVLMRIIDISSLQVTVPVSPATNSRIVADQEARVVSSELPSRSFLGKVVRKAQPHSAQPRDVSASIELPNPEGLLKPGMYVRVRLMFDQNNDPRIASFPAWLGKKGGPGGDGKVGGPQSDAELLNNLKGLTQTMSTMASELEHREQAAKETAEASRVHFFALEKLIGRLREDSTTIHKLNFEKTAEAIDNLPALHVDEELLAFSTDVSRALREMSERKRAIARETSSVDWTNWDRTQAAVGAVKSQGLQRINSAMTEMRRKLTRKYNLEFLITAERTPAPRRASGHGRR